MISIMLYSYVLKPGASLHSEHELRQLLSPEDVCAFDSTRGVRTHLFRMGVKYPEKLMSMSMEKWRLAIELLPEEKVGWTIQIMGSCFGVTYL